MASKALVSVYSTVTGNTGWRNLPTPSEYYGVSSTLVNTARNVNGEVIGSVVKSDLAKIELKWNYLTVAQYATISQYFEPKYNGNYFIKVKYFDMIKGGWEEADSNSEYRVFYVGDRKVQVAHIVLDSTTGSPKGYNNVSLSLIDTGRRETV